MNEQEIKNWKAVVRETQAVWQNELEEYQDMKIEFMSRRMAIDNLQAHARDCQLCKMALRINHDDCCEVCIVTYYFEKCDNLDEFRNYTRCLGDDGSRKVTDLIEYTIKVIDKLQQLYCCLEGELALIAVRQRTYPYRIKE